MNSIRHAERSFDGRDESVSARIAESLADRIVSGQLAPGARVMQDHVAAEFQASHVPVREAFRKLEAQGLLVNKPRCGVRVSDLDPAIVTEITEMRAVLEGLALSHALPRIGDADLEAARRALADGDASDQIAVWEAANRRFHLALTAPCGMPRLMAAIGDHHRSAARFLFATWKELDWQPRSDTEHRAILDAVVRRDAEPARALLEAHVRDAGRALVKRLHGLAGTASRVVAMAVALAAGSWMLPTQVSAQTQTSTRIEVPAPIVNLPNGTSAAVWAGNTLYVSGSLDPDIKSHPDTESQTVGVLTFLQKLLESQKLTMGDVAMARVYLGADPAKGGKMDFAGMMAGWTQFFGTKAQPNKPARTTVQVVLPAGERGALVEIDLIAVRP